MKSLKISFVAIIAVLALGVTIAAQAGIFESKKSAVAGPCYGPQITLKASNCPATNKVIAIGDPCSKPVVGDHLFTLGATTVDPTLCSTGSTFCCLETVIDQAPCTSQPRLNGYLGNNFYSVAIVRCQP